PHLAPALPGCDADHIIYNFAADLPPQPPRPIEEYDFQLVMIAFRWIVFERHHMPKQHADLAAYEAAFEAAVERMRQLLDAALQYYRESGKLTFVTNFFVPQQSPLGRLLPRADLRNPAFLCDRLNNEMENYTGSMRDVHVVDVNGISAGFGKHWVQDDFLWTF